MKNITMPLLLLISPAFGQTVIVIDNSAAGNPMPVRGSITFNNDGSITCSISGHDNAVKPIVAYAFTLDVTNPKGSPHIYYGGGDRFLPVEVHSRAGKVTPEDSGLKQFAGPVEDFPIRVHCDSWLAGGGQPMTRGAQLRSIKPYNISC